MSKKTNTKKEAFLKREAERGDFYKKNRSYISFNFKYFTYGDGYGQSFEEWEKDQLLSDLCEKLKAFSGKSRTELIQDRILEIYNIGYPKGSEFKKPNALMGIDIDWARFRIDGKKRLIGFFMKNYGLTDEGGAEKENYRDVFYVVFLDKEHQFAPAPKKHT